jgi:hypothetical protein
MNGNRYSLIAALVVLVVAALFVAALLRPTGEKRTRETVERFGKTLQQVSLLAPDAAEQIAAHYAPYVDASLLQSWQAAPDEAPGRTTSSPYPDRIEITDMTPQGAGYTVFGEVVEVTATGESGRDSVVMLVVPEEDGYRIAAYQEQAPAQ